MTDPIASTISGKTIEAPNSHRSGRSARPLVARRPAGCGDVSCTLSFLGFGPADPGDHSNEYWEWMTPSTVARGFRENWARPVSRLRCSAKLLRSGAPLTRDRSKRQHS